MPAAGRHGRPRPRHLERRHAARRRRQGGRGGDHGRRRPTWQAHPELPRPHLARSRSPRTRRSGTARRCSTFPGSARAAPTRSTDPSAVSCRMSRSAPMRCASRSPASGSTPALPPASSSARCASRRRSSPRCPTDRLTPETTSGREGFIHPTFLHGATDKAEARWIVRDFDESLLESHVALLRETTERVASANPGAEVEFEVIRQYRNMREYIEGDPDVVAAAEDGVRGRGHRADPPADPRRHRWLAAVRDGPADAQHLRRRPRVPLGAGVRVAAGHGRLRQR